MISKAATDRLEFRSAQDEDSRAEIFLTQKIWLPKLVYDFLPYFYLTASFAAFFATLYISDWFWVLPHYLLISAAIFHLAFSVMSKRSENRKQSRLSQDAPPG